MIEFGYNKKECSLVVFLPDRMKFNYYFHCDISELLKRALSGEDEIREILIYCSPKSDYEKMCKAYLLNVIRFLMGKRKRVKWHRNLAELIVGVIEKRDGEDFAEIDINKEILKDNLFYYDFKGDKGVQKPVDEIAKILVDKNLTINTETVKEFLSTTIGEIFSNSINHSDQEEIFFMYDIMYEEDVYLSVNIIDYGTTIIENVQNYFLSKNKEEIGCVECLEWAIQSGNTTREGSGGYGLPMLISYIQNIKGELFIFSGEAGLNLKKEGQICKERVNGDFCGTSITFKVKLYNTDRAIKYDESLEKLVSIGLDSI